MGEYWKNSPRRYMIVTGAEKLKQNNKKKVSFDKNNNSKQANNDSAQEGRAYIR